jgi:hypothetical protein
MNALKCALLSSVALAFAWAAAFTPELSESDIQEAVEAGTQMVSQRSGYHLQDWVLYGIADPLSILPGQGEVEAVIVATPFELLRYQAFLVAFQDKTFTAEQADALAAELKDTVSFQVFVHAPAEGDQYRDFLSGFTKASFTASDGTDLTPVKIDTFGPAQDFYNIPGGTVQIRYLGYVIYRFDLSSLNEPAGNLANLTGTFSLTDTTGQAYSYDVDLSKYR